MLPGYGLVQEFARCTLGNFSSSIQRLKELLRLQRLLDAIEVEPVLKLLRLVGKEQLRSRKWNPNDAATNRKANSAGLSVQAWKL